jgi:threonyl-tRNA synthetase
MPIRYFEPATVYRDEKSGQLGGLTRVRSITQDDGHLFCRVSQLGQELKTIVEIIKKFYTTMDMMNDYWVRLSLRGDDKTKYLGSDQVWNTAESVLTKVCEESQLPFRPAKGEAAFYGPKLDFMFKDVIGREWQLATIQCDFNLPERFDLSFINERGEKERPVVIHRAISGALERFMGVLIEHYAGNFPLWLSPVQIKILPISEKYLTYAREVNQKLLDAKLRTQLDESNETLGKKIRQTKVEKIPYVIVIGDKEVAGNKLTVESRRGKLENVSVEQLAQDLLEEIKERK